MSDSMEASISGSIRAPGGADRTTQWLVWAMVSVALMLVALVAYALLSGAFEPVAPRTAQEDVLAATEASIAEDPTNGAPYASRAEALFATGQKDEAFQVLAGGEAAVKRQNPALLYILRTWTALLNREGRFAEAEAVGQRAIKASDDYLEAQGTALLKKGVTPVGGNTQTRMSVDTAIQVAEAYMGLKSYDEAIDLYAYALHLEPTAADILSMRGWAYIEKGDKTKAKADFQQALAYLPGDPYATSGMKKLAE